MKPHSAAIRGTAPWAQAPSGNSGDGICQAKPLGVKQRSAARGAHTPLGASAEREWWRWYTPSRTTRDEAAFSGDKRHRPLGASAEREWWRWYMPSQTTRGEAAFSGERGHSPLGASAEREKWRWYTEIRTTTLYPEEAEQADGCPATSLVVNSNPGAARFESTEKWRWGESNPRPRSLEKSSLHV